MAFVGFITCGNFAEAKKISKALLEKRLVACANIIPEIRSSYFWKGRLEHAKESLLIVKTRKALAKKIFAEAKKLHSYELPSIEFFSAQATKEIESWIEKETRQ